MSKAEKTCTVCGATFIGGAGAMYCPSCKRTKKAEMERERRKNGSKRKIGSTDICEKCGAEYTVKGPLQKYCDNCKPVTHHAKDRPPKIEIVPTKKKYAPRNPKLKKCTNCDAEFYSTWNHVYYCPDCRIKQMAVYSKRQREKRGRNSDKRIGATISCAGCGAQFTTTATNQKFCPSCREARKKTPKITSDVTGVSFVRESSRWMARYKNKFLGIFDTEEEAIEARKEAESIAENRRCVVCGKEIPMGKGYGRAKTCSPECRKAYKQIYKESKFGTASETNPEYKHFSFDLPAKMKDRICTEAQKVGYTASKYIRELIQKEFDRLDEAKGGGDDERK